MLFLKLQWVIDLELRLLNSKECLRSTICCMINFPWSLFVCILFESRKASYSHSKPNANYSPQPPFKTLSPTHLQTPYASTLKSHPTSHWPPSAPHHSPQTQTNTPNHLNSTTPPHTAHHSQSLHPRTFLMCRYPQFPCTWSASDSFYWTCSTAYYSESTPEQSESKHSTGTQRCNCLSF